jgi:hypothetical protein
LIASTLAAPFGSFAAETKSASKSAGTTALHAPAASAAKPNELDEEAREKLDLRIQPDTGIYVVQYNKTTNSFIVRIESEPAVGPNYTTADWLADAIDNGTTAAEFKKKPQRVVGSYFRTKKKLWLLSDDELSQRLENSKKPAKKNHP